MARRSIWEAALANRWPLPPLWPVNVARDRLSPAQRVRRIVDELRDRRIPHAVFSIGTGHYAGWLHNKLARGRGCDFRNWFDQELDLCERTLEMPHVWRLDRRGQHFKRRERDRQGAFISSHNNDPAR